LSYLWLALCFGDPGLEVGHFGVQRRQLLQPPGAAAMESRPTTVDRLVDEV